MGLLIAQGLLGEPTPAGDSPTMVNAGGLPYGTCPHPGQANNGQA